MRTENAPSLARRHFIQSSMTVAAGFLGLRQFAAAGAATPTIQKFGPLVKDPKGILDLPKGLNYTVISETGQSMDDGLIVPGYPDGMGAFTGADGKVLLVRNHELESKGEDDKADKFRALGPFSEKNKLYGKIDKTQLYDRGESGAYPSLGGTTTLVYDPKTRKLERQFLSLAGTERNCAGGITPWGTWLTCEESAEVPNGEFLERHGYVFEVKPEADGSLQKAQPYREMGRFRREAVAIDPATGIVYMTEDMGDGLFYRFIPNTPEKLGEGGRVQALTIVDQRGVDTRNWPKEKDGAGEGTFPIGESVGVAWVDVDQPDSPKDDLRKRGHKDNGAAIFARGEGIWYSEKDHAIYFAATSGGAKKMGQIFRYHPSENEGDLAAEKKNPAQLELFIEPNDKDILKAADNLTIAPWGDVIFCEDFSTDSFVKGITQHGEIYEIAYNAKSGSEFAGACFAPEVDDVLFVNIQKPGLTLAIHGITG